MADSIQKTTNILNNGIKTTSKITLNMKQGILNGNIIDAPIYPPAAPECIQSGLDFSCSDNSQYINVI